MIARQAFTRLGGGLLAAVALGPWHSCPAAYAAADGCSPRLRSDFNGDGRSTRSVADPYAIRQRIRAGLWDAWRRAGRGCRVGGVQTGVAL